MKSLKILPITFLILILLTSCLGSSDKTPVSPGGLSDSHKEGFSPDTSAGLSFAPRYLLGYYYFVFDADMQTVEVVPIREIAGHFNVLNFLETWPCTNCVKVPEVNPLGDDRYMFGVEITHPFPSLNLSGFDVRGIALFEGSKEFPNLEQTVPDAEAGTGELINPDGYTSLYGEWTIPLSPPLFQTYIPGNFSSATVPSATINGYKRFESNVAGNTRHVFYAGDAITNYYLIDMPDSQFIFGYAVDASWVAPTTKPVTDPIADFPPEANCPEPWELHIEVDPIGPGLNLGGGATELIISVRDNEPGTHGAPVIECPDLFPGLETAVFEDMVGNNSQYRMVISNLENPSPVTGDFKVLVRVRDDLYGTTDEWIDLAAYRLEKVHVGETTHGGWASTWGGDSYDIALAVEADLYGNVYVGGYFHGEVDFDPGPDVDKWTSVSDTADAFLTRYDSQGTYQYTKAWGGGGTDSVNDIAIDINGNVYCVGQWEMGIDLDPDPDETWLYASVGNTEGYISKFNLAGDFLWGQNIHGLGADTVNSVDCRLSNVYVTGNFENNAAFDQEETGIYPSNGVKDAFIAKYGADGVMIWAKTLGSTDNDYGNAVACTTDDYVAWVGSFGTNSGGSPVDFDPSDTLEDLHTSNGNTDIFLAWFHPSGNYLKGVSFGGTGIDYGFGVDVSGSIIYTCGSFQGEVDFNPDPSLWNTHTSNGGFDAWACRFDTDLGQSWGKTWGGMSDDVAKDLAPDTFGGLYVCGNFEDTVDFDPGTGTEEKASNGSIDIFLLKLTTGGNYTWVRTIGGTGTDWNPGVDVGEYAFPYMCGTFSHIVDFGPPIHGPDNHSTEGEQDCFVMKYLLNGEW